MPPDETLLNRVRTSLPHDIDVQEKRMFGGLTFMVGGKMCVSVGRDRIMCRIDPDLHDSALARNGCKTVVMKGREYRGFVYVNADVLKSKKELEYWIWLALDYNRRAKASRRKKP